MPTRKNRRNLRQDKSFAPRRRKKQSRLQEVTENSITKQSRIPVRDTLSVLGANNYRKKYNADLEILDGMISEELFPLSHFNAGGKTSSQTYRNVDDGVCTFTCTYPVIGTGVGGEPPYNYIHYNTFENVEVPVGHCVYCPSNAYAGDNERQDFEDTGFACCGCKGERLGWTYTMWLGDGCCDDGANIQKQYGNIRAGCCAQGNTCGPGGTELSCGNLDGMYCSDWGECEVDDYGNVACGGHACNWSCDCFPSCADPNNPIVRQQNGVPCCDWAWIYGDGAYQYESDGSGPHNVRMVSCSDIHVNGPIGSYDPADGTSCFENSCAAFNHSRTQSTEMWGDDLGYGVLPVDFSCDGWSWGCGDTHFPNWHGQVQSLGICSSAGGECVGEFADNPPPGDYASYLDVPDMYHHCNARRGLDATCLGKCNRSFYRTSSQDSIWREIAEASNWSSVDPGGMAITGQVIDGKNGTCFCNDGCYYCNCPPDNAHCYNVCPGNCTNPASSAWFIENSQAGTVPNIDCFPAETDEGTKLGDCCGDWQEYCYLGYKDLPCECYSQGEELTIAPSTGVVNCTITGNNYDQLCGAQGWTSGTWTDATCETHCNDWCERQEVTAGGIGTNLTPVQNYCALWDMNVNVYGVEDPVYWAVQPYCNPELYSNGSTWNSSDGCGCECTACFPEDSITLYEYDPQNEGGKVGCSMGTDALGNTWTADVYLGGTLQGYESTLFDGTTILGNACNYDGWAECTREHTESLGYGAGGLFENDQVIEASYCNWSSLHLNGTNANSCWTAIPPYTDQDYSFEVSPNRIWELTKVQADSVSGTAWLDWKQYLLFGCAGCPDPHAGNYTGDCITTTRTRDEAGNYILKDMTDQVPVGGPRDSGLGCPYGPNEWETAEDWSHIPGCDTQMCNYEHGCLHNEANNSDGCGVQEADLQLCGVCTERGTYQADFEYGYCDGVPTSASDDLSFLSDMINLDIPTLFCGLCHGCTGAETSYNECSTCGGRWESLHQENCNATPGCSWTDDGDVRHYQYSSAPYGPEETDNDNCCDYSYYCACTNANACDYNPTCNNDLATNGGFCVPYGNTYDAGGSVGLIDCTQAGLFNDGQCHMPTPMCKDSDGDGSPDTSDLTIQERFCDPASGFVTAQMCYTGAYDCVTEIGQYNGWDYVPCAGHSFWNEDEPTAGDVDEMCPFAEYDCNGNCCDGVNIWENGQPTETACVIPDVCGLCGGTWSVIPSCEGQECNGMGGSGGVWDASGGGGCGFYGSNNLCTYIDGTGNGIEYCSCPQGPGGTDSDYQGCIGNGFSGECNGAQYDCNSVCGGGAELDACDVCGGSGADCINGFDSGNACSDSYYNGYIDFNFSAECASCPCNCGGQYLDCKGICQGDAEVTEIALDTDGDGYCVESSITSACLTPDEQAQVGVTILIGYKIWPIACDGCGTTGCTETSPSDICIYQNDGSCIGTVDPETACWDCRGPGDIANCYDPTGDGPPAAGLNDCNGDCGGTAIIDDCGVCCEGETETVCSWRNVLGSGDIDECGLCPGESVGGYYNPITAEEVVITYGSTGCSTRDWNNCQCAGCTNALSPVWTPWAKWSTTCSSEDIAAGSCDDWFWKSGEGDGNDYCNNDMLWQDCLGSPIISGWFDDTFGVTWPAPPAGPGSEEAQDLWNAMREDCFAGHGPVKFMYCANNVTGNSDGDQCCPEDPVGFAAGQPCPSTGLTYDGSCASTYGGFCCGIATASTEAHCKVGERSTLMWKVFRSVDFADIVWTFDVELGLILDWYSSTLPAGDVAGTTILGQDIGQGVVNVVDIVSVVGAILGNQEFNQWQFQLADINQDGTINVVDVVSIVGSILGGMREGGSISEKESVLSTNKRNELMKALRPLFDNSYTNRKKVYYPQVDDTTRNTIQTRWETYDTTRRSSSDRSTEYNIRYFNLLFNAPTCMDYTTTVVELGPRFDASENGYGWTQPSLTQYTSEYVQNALRVWTANAQGNLTVSTDDPILELLTIYHPQVHLQADPTFVPNVGSVENAIGYIPESSPFCDSISGTDDDDQYCVFESNEDDCLAANGGNFCQWTEATAEVCTAFAWDGWVPVEPPPNCIPPAEVKGIFGFNLDHYDVEEHCKLGTDNLNNNGCFDTYFMWLPNGIVQPGVNDDGTYNLHNPQCVLPEVWSGSESGGGDGD